MKKKFTTYYYDDYDDYEYEYGKQPEGFNTIDEAIKWNEDRNIPIYLIRLTEWDVENIDAYGVPEILQQGNLESWKYKDLTPMS